MAVAQAQPALVSHKSFVGSVLLIYLENRLQKFPGQTGDPSNA